MNARLKKELIDQSAHFVAGLAATCAVAMLINVIYAAVIVMIFAIAREIKQRLDRKDVWYGCAWGCRLDLIFLALGIGTAYVLM